MDQPILVASHVWRRPVLRCYLWDETAYPQIGSRQLASNQTIDFVTYVMLYYVTSPLQVVFTVDRLVV